LGDFEAFAGQFQYQHKYNRIIIDNSNIIPNKIEDKIYTIGGKYNYYQEKINFSFSQKNNFKPIICCCFFSISEKHKN
jgi:hypothetical protein